jgi:DNA-binding PadR family transcriptional regulator
VPKSALDNPLILPILGLLVEQPRHPYAVFAELRRRYPFLQARSATVYTLIETLKALDWVETRDAGEHETLHPTSTGAGALAERVEAEVRGGDLTGGPSSVAALAYLSIMPPRRAARALRARATAIGDEARQLQEALDGAGTAEIHMIEVHYLLSRLKHDIQWLTGTAHRIETGELTWSRTRRLPTSHRRLTPERAGMISWPKHTGVQR